MDLEKLSRSLLSLFCDGYFNISMGKLALQGFVYNNDKRQIIYLTYPSSKDNQKLSLEAVENHHIEIFKTLAPEEEHACYNFLHHSMIYGNIPSLKFLLSKSYELTDLDFDFIENKDITVSAIDYLISLDANPFNENLSIFIGDNFRLDIVEYLFAGEREGKFNKFKGTKFNDSDFEKKHGPFLIMMSIIINQSIYNGDKGMKIVKYILNNVSLEERDALINNIDDESWELPIEYRYKLTYYLYSLGVEHILDNKMLNKVIKLNILSNQ